MQIFRVRRGYFSIGVMALAIVCGLAFNLAKSLDNDDSGIIVRRIPTTHKVIALTFDDGPHRKTTPEILKTLKQKNVKATFFVLGENAETNPGLVAQALADGHEIASHGYSHKKINSLSAQEIQREISETEKILAPVAPKPVLFRPPYGAYNDKTVLILRQNGYTTVLWTIDSNDWRMLSVDQVVKNVLSPAVPGKIILMHDGQYPIPTIDALPIIIDRLHGEGYEFVTMSELLNYYEVRK